MTRVKVCCISSSQEAELALSAGADALGLVSEMPSGPGVIDLATIAEIAALVPANVGTFLLTSKQDPALIIAQQRACKTNTLQLCDALPAGSHAQLRQALPDVTLVQVIHVRDASSIDEALAVAGEVDALLLDSGNTSLSVKELGGTGRTHDWRLSARIVKEAGVPVYLAGGLSARNVRLAINAVQPYGLDLCSGVRSKDQLDGDKLAAFMQAVRRADARSRHPPTTALP